MKRWKPIETAPKDKSDVLLFGIVTGSCGPRDEPEIVVGWWDEMFWAIECLDEWGPKVEATHWMPLPKPPKTGLKTGPGQNSGDGE
jgi:hypothetical protein